MSQELTLTKTASLLPSEDEFKQLQSMAKTASQSAYYKAFGGYENIFMITAAARELGIPPIMALNGGLHNIQGKVEISARILNSLIRTHKHSIKVLESSGKACRLEGKRADNADTCQVSYTLDDAKAAGLLGKTNWKLHTEDMLWARAISKLARRLFPDVIGTAYVEGEIRESKIEHIDAEEVEAVVVTSGKTLASLAVQLAPDGDALLAEEYLTKYCAHWGKSVEEVEEIYEDRTKFEKEFGKWRSKKAA